MKKFEKFLAGLITGGLICMIIYALTSCSPRYVTTEQAANGKAKCGMRLINK